MGLPSRVLSRVFRLPSAGRSRASRIREVRHIRVPTQDGFHLLTDHYAPLFDGPSRAGPYTAPHIASRAGPAGAPTILIRTPYGRGGALAVVGRTFARHGFHMVVQACRGTDGSSGVFEPLLHERADGMDTLEWLRRRPWYVGRLGLFGASYLGFVQWSIAADAGDELGAMVAVVTASQTRDSTYSGGAFSLDTVLTWAELIAAQSVPFWTRQLELRRGQPKLWRGFDHLPLNEADRIATGATVPFFQEWLGHAEGSGIGTDYWARRVHDHRIADVRAPVAMVTGWHDIFLPAQLADYAALRAAGRRPHLVVGPWTHGSVGLYGAALREGLAWFRTHLLGEHGPAPDRPVRVHIGGNGRRPVWRDLARWPPSHVDTPWYLHGGFRLGPDWPRPSTPDSLRYDPSDPTPSLGGPLLVGNRAGQKNNRALEARPDVLTYTSAVLRSPLDLLGLVTATLYLESQLEHFDVYIRLCDVDRAGRSWNVCDGLTRVVPPLVVADADANAPTAGETEGGVKAVTVELWPTGYRFRAGHRLRVQVSGGAHPRYARNPGTPEPLGTATVLRAGTRLIHHTPAHPSAITLPVNPARLTT